jgi:hypothetical protein
VAGPEAEDSGGELRGRDSVQEAWEKVEAAAERPLAEVTAPAAIPRQEAARRRRWHPRPSEALQA